MSPRVLGNDVVDLRDPDARPERLHPRFDAKAFRASERAWIGTGPAANRRRWCLWAAKEAAYKALRQEHPDLRFAPRRFRATLDARGRGWVEVTGGACATQPMPVHVTWGIDWVHALALRGDPRDARLQVAELEGPADPRRRVRRLLRESFREPGRVRVRRIERVPHVQIDGRAAALPVSLSHHGRFVACARLEPAGDGVAA